MHTETISQSQTSYPICPLLLCTHFKHLLFMELKGYSLWDGLPLLLKSHSQFFQVPWGLSRFLTLSLSTAYVFNCFEVSGFCRPVHHISPSLSYECCTNSGSMRSSIVMLKHLYLWMVLHEWLHIFL